MDVLTQRAEMTVGHVLPFRGGVGGAEVATLRLAEAAGRCGIRSVMFSVPNPRVVEFFRSHGYRVVEFEEVQPSYRHPSKYWRASRDLARQLRHESIDLVHCADVLGAYYTSLAAVLARKKLVSHVRGQHRNLSRRDCSFLAPVSRFVFVSEAAWKSFSCKVSSRRGLVLYDGIDLAPEVAEEERAAHASAVRQRYAIPSARRIIGMLARVSLQKDLPTLVRAAASLLATHDACFLIVGDNAGPYAPVYDETRRLIAELNLAERFIFTGHRDDARQFIPGMDVCVLSSHEEGLGLVVMEYMCEGKPVAATEVGGIPEMVVHEKTGLLHPHGDHERLAANLRRLLDDAELANRLGDAGRDLVRSRFSREQFEHNVAEMYRRWV